MKKKERGHIWHSVNFDPSKKQKEGTYGILEISKHSYETLDPVQSRVTEMSLKNEIIM